MSNNNSVKVDTSKRIDVLAANQSGHQLYQKHQHHQHQQQSQQQQQQQQQLHQGQKRSTKNTSKEVFHFNSSFNNDVFDDVDNDFFKQSQQSQRSSYQSQSQQPSRTSSSSSSPSPSSSHGHNTKQSKQQSPQQQQHSNSSNIDKKYTVFDNLSFGGLDDSSSIQSDNEDEYGFCEIKDQVISTNGCSKYFIPFLQTKEMCSNEARKWLAKRWFLPSDREEIEWTKQNRYYYPVYVFKLSVTTKFSAYFTVKDESGAKDAKDMQMRVQETLSSDFDEVIVCASSSIDVSLVESLIFKNSYSHRYPYFLPDTNEWKPITDDKLSEKTLSIDISRDDIWVDKVLVYIEQKQKERCQQFVQKKHNVSKVTLDMGQVTIDKESYSIVYLPVSADTFRYGEAHYDTLTSGNIGKTVGRSPKGTGMVGATLYGVISGVSKVVSDSI